MNHPLNSRRYAELCERLNSFLILAHKYLSLRVEEMEKKKEARAHIREIFNTDTENGQHPNQ